MKAISGLVKGTGIGTVILIFWFVTAHARTFYVACNHPSASDSNPGTLAMPWKTIQHAAETAVAGDTVLIRAGMYHEAVHFQHDGNTTAGPIVFAAYPGEKPILDGTGVDASNGIIWTKSYLILSGLTIRNWNGNGIWVEGGAAFFQINDCEVYNVVYGIGIADGAHDFTLNRTICHHFDLYGFDVSPLSGHFCYNGSFNDCIAHTGRDPGQNVDGFALGHGNQHHFSFMRCIAYGVFDGFDISARETYLYNCLAHNCANSAYKSWQDQVFMVNCIGYHCTNSIVELDWDGQSGATYLVHCTLYDGMNYGVWVENSADKLAMYNCIIAGGDNIGLAFEQMGTTNYGGDYNIFHNDGLRAVAVAYTDEFSLDDLAAGKWTDYSKQDAHSIVVKNDATIFVDPAKNNFHLLPNSPAIDRGTEVLSSPFDFEGLPRPYGAGIDIGAYEYSPSSMADYPHGDVLLPKSLKLLQNYPNPFNCSTVIEFTLQQSAEVAVKIYNANGQLSRELFRGHCPAGLHKLDWDGCDAAGRSLPSGVYLIRLEAASESAVIRTVVVK